MSVDDRLMAKLRALAEMADRGTEHEAEVAATRLAELMAKHHVESLEVDAPEIGVEDSRLDDVDENAPPSRTEKWELILLASVAEACGGRPFMRGKGRYLKLRMFGPLGSGNHARYMYQWLRRQINTMSRAATRARGETNAWRRAYASGVVAKVYARMTAARRVVFEAASSTALVLVDRQKTMIDERMAGMRPRKAKSLKRPGAAYEGYVDGDAIDIGSASGVLGRGAQSLPPGNDD